MFNIFIVVCLKQETVEKPEEQCDHDKVGEEGGEPDDLAGGVEALGDDEVDDDPGDDEAASQLPLHSSKPVLQPRILLQNSVPAKSSHQLF